METPREQFRILVVDDEAVVCSLMMDALEEEGHMVSTAQNGPDALEMIKSNPPDLLITDIRMPEISGTELASLSREIHPAIGVVFMTGYASLNSAKDAIKHGALDYILKPFELTEIRQAVSNALDKLENEVATNSNQKLTGLSDLSDVLFAAGDQKSLAISSLKFAMMHLHSKRGSIMYLDNKQDTYVMLTLDHESKQEEVLAKEPLYSLMQQEGVQNLKEPTTIDCIDDHPIYEMQPCPELQKQLCPPWLADHADMVVTPIMRADSFSGLIMLEIGEDTTRFRQSDLKFLSIAASQLAVMFENANLLEKTQSAYARLKALQEETIELEKMATRGEMSAEIGHELNNFLAVVAGNVELLSMNLEKKRYDKMDKYLTKVTNTMEKIKIFTSNLMDLRTISSEKEMTTFDQILSEVVEYIQTQKRFRGIEIIMPEQSPHAPFMADTTQIRQLLYNLLNNAADALTGCKVRRITLEMNENPDEESFRLSIKDTGQGFDPELLAKAFQEKFTTKKTGHGFGLVVCKRIIENHNGELNVDSTPGEGTEISITFPFATDQAQLEQNAQLVLAE